MSTFNPYLQSAAFGEPPGDPDGLDRMAGEFEAIATDLVGIGRRVGSTVDGIPTWEGSGAAAARTNARESADETQTVAEALQNGATALRSLASAIRTARIQISDARYQAERVAATDPFQTWASFAPSIQHAEQATVQLEQVRRIVAEIFATLTVAAPHYEPPAPSPPEDEPERGWFTKAGHGILDVAGLVPVIGEPADLVNAAWYLGEGDTLNAGLSAGSAIPIAGYGFTGAKGVKRVAGVADVGRAAARSGDDLVSAAARSDDLGVSLRRNMDELSAVMGGAGRVPPVGRPIKAGDPPPRQPGRGTAGSGPPPGSTRRLNKDIGTGFDRTPVETDRFGDAVRSAHAARQGGAARAGRGGADGARGGQLGTSRMHNPTTTTDGFRGAGAGPLGSGGQRAADRAGFREGGRLADDVNAGHLQQGHFPPWSRMHSVTDEVTKHDQTMVRVFTEGNQKGSWLMKKSDLEGLTPAQIRDKFALPELPTRFSTVFVPAGSRLRAGTAGSITPSGYEAIRRGTPPSGGWGTGGGLQYQAHERLTGFGKVSELPGRF